MSETPATFEAPRIYRVHAGMHATIPAVPVAAVTAMSLFDRLPERIRKRLWLCTPDLKHKPWMKDRGPCWLWMGSTSGNGKGGGYGRVSWLNCSWAVHRLVWTLLKGWLAPLKQLDHLCERRLCCNPDHMEPVTNKRNQHRRVKAAKKRNGEPAWSSKSAYARERQQASGARRSTACGGETDGNQEADVGGRARR